jgi:hypothetical protein
VLLRSGTHQQNNHTKDDASKSRFAHIHALNKLQPGLDKWKGNRIADHHRP